MEYLAFFLITHILCNLHFIRFKDCLPNQLKYFKAHIAWHCQICLHWYILLTKFHSSTLNFEYVTMVLWFICNVTFHLPYDVIPFSIFFMWFILWCQCHLNLGYFHSYNFGNDGLGYWCVWCPHNDMATWYWCRCCICTHKRTN